jgi:predicted SnoaL-like aldol condensation-catalyzing enzyme
MEFKKIIFILALLIFLGDFAMASNLQKAKDAFDHLDKNHLNVVDEFYDENAVFQDPVHEIKGTKAIRSYYEGLYKKVDSIRFQFKRTSEVNDLVTLEWSMFLRTPSIDSGKEITLDGVSLITFGGKDGKVISHRDYFDMGEFIYERVPVLRSVIGYIKRKMAGESSN